MNGKNPTEGDPTEINPAVTRLETLVEELENCLKDSMGKNATWENLVSNKITALKTTIQTVLNHKGLPEGMTLRELEKSVRELISQKPQNT